VKRIDNDAISYTILYWFTCFSEHMPAELPRWLPIKRFSPSVGFCGYVGTALRRSFFVWLALNKRPEFLITPGLFGIGDTGGIRRESNSEKAATTAAISGWAFWKSLDWRLVAYYCLWERHRPLSGKANS